MKPTFPALIVTVSLFVVAGCAGEDSRIETGNAALEWQVAARDCVTAGVSEIQVTLSGESRSEKGFTEWRFSCAERVGIVEALRPGRYTFDLIGVDDDGEAVFEGGTGEVEIRASGTVRPPTVILHARPGVLEVKWTFGGPFCTHVGVEAIELIAFDAYGSAILEQGLRCEMGRSTIALRPGLYDIALFALDRRGRIRYQSVFDVEMQRGREVAVEVVLE